MLSKQDGEMQFYAGYTPRGYQQITSLSSATGLTVPTNAHFAIIVAEGNTVRWRDAGVDPTASVGMPLPALSYFFYTGNLAAIKFIQVAPTAVLNVVYY